MYNKEKYTQTSGWEQGKYVVFYFIFRILLWDILYYYNNDYLLMQLFY